MKLTIQLLALLAAANSPVFAANQWEIDPQHSSASFSVKHMMVSNVRGQVGGVTGTVDFDGKNVNDLKVNASLDPSTINTGEPNRDQHLRGTDFFDVAKYPKITFVSTGTVANLDGGFKLGGKLTMHGVTKNVELSVDGPTAPIKDKKGNIKIGASATTSVHRKDFGIEYNSILDNGGVAISDDVKITLDLELTKRADNSKAETK